MKLNVRTSGENSTPAHTFSGGAYSDWTEEHKSLECQFTLAYPSEQCLAS